MTWTGSCRDDVGRRTRGRVFSGRPARSCLLREGARLRHGTSTCFPWPLGKQFGTLATAADGRDHTNRSLWFPERACRITLERTPRTAAARCSEAFHPVSERPHQGRIGTFLRGCSARSSRNHPQRRPGHVGGSSSRCSITASFRSGERAEKFTEGPTGNRRERSGRSRDPSWQGPFPIDCASPRGKPKGTICMVTRSRRSRRAFQNVSGNHRERGGAPCPSRRAEPMPVTHTTAK